MNRLAGLLFALGLIGTPLVSRCADTNTTPPSPADQRLAAYFRDQTVALAARCLADVRTPSDWASRCERYRQELLEMLGLWPMPERTDLRPVVTGRLQHDDFVVEKLHFQALPRLYVTANLYLPRNLTGPAPAVLYVCGHSRVVTNGVSCGNKAGYQHHGAWLARHGYVCLLIDTLQLGEIEGQHHGTYRQGQWWWNARGYTPAGVEAWFGIRALDYLDSRPEVDRERIGMTGRSGGGSYSWTVAALDPRVKVVVPVAGITDLQNQVVDGCIEGHCDCMFFVNTYRWDFPQLAALVAPRPLLLANSDKDKIFPLDGVVRLHEKVRRIYQLHGAADRLGLLITEGPHADTQELQLPALRWFNRWLKGEQPLIDSAARKYFAPEQLRVFDQLPADQINTIIQEQFVPQAAALPPSERPQSPGALLAALRQKSFGGWPTERTVPAARLAGSGQSHGLRWRTWQFESQPHVELTLGVVEHPKVRRPQRVVLAVLDQAGWTNMMATLAADGDRVSDDGAEGLRNELLAGRQVLAFVAPRGIGPDAWSGDERKQTHIRRRFMLLGQTVDGMRVWDIQQAVAVVRSMAPFRRLPVDVRARGPMGVNALYASLFEPAICNLDLAELPASHRDGPDYLNVLKLLDIEQALALAGPRVRTR